MKTHRLPRLIVLGTLALLSGTAPLLAQDSSLTAQADAIFANFGDDTPGAAVAVVRDGEIVFRAGYGMANLGHGIRIGPETVFDVASVSKQFAGMAVAMLVEAGEIDLDAPVRTYLDEIPDFGVPLTVRHLVHHVSGIRDWPATLAVAGWRMDDVISFDQILRMAWSQRELNFPPGAEYSYSNTGYNLLAEVVTRVTGGSFREWTGEHIFGPLAMTSTHFQDNHAEIVPDKAQGYAGSRDFFAAPNGLTALGSSSLHSSVDDIARWLINFDTHRVGGTAVVERMRTRGVLNSGDTIAYAYGLSRGEYRGRETWAHSGSWAGFRTYVVHFPELRAGVVVLSNSGVYNPSRASYRVADLFLEDALGPRPAPEAPARNQDDTTEEPTPTAVELEAYTGIWVSDELDTRYTLSVQDGRLVAEHRRHGTIRLTASGPDRFRSDQWFFQPVRFVRDGRGAVVEMLVGAGRARNLKFRHVERAPAPI